MILQKYKIDVIIDLVFIMSGPVLILIINIPTTKLKSKFQCSQCEKVNNSKTTSSNFGCDTYDTLTTFSRTLSAK